MNYEQYLRMGGITGRLTPARAQRVAEINPHQAWTLGPRPAEARGRDVRAPAPRLRLRSEAELRLDARRRQRDAADAAVRARLLNLDFRIRCLRMEPPPGWRVVRFEE